MPSQSLSLPITDTASVTLDSSGNGTAKLTPFGPRNGGLTWEVDSVSVSVTIPSGQTAPVNESTAKLYLSYGVQSAGPQDLLGQSGTGSSGDTCGIGKTIRPNDWITVVWSGGDAGQIATFRVFGTINPPGTS